MNLLLLYYTIYWVYSTSTLYTPLKISQGYWDVLVAIHLIVSSVSYFDFILCFVNIFRYPKNNATHFRCSHNTVDNNNNNILLLACLPQNALLNVWVFIMHVE